MTDALPDMVKTAMARANAAEARARELEAVLRKRVIDDDTLDATCGLCWKPGSGYGIWRLGSPENHAPGCLAALRQSGSDVPHSWLCAQCLGQWNTGEAEQHTPTCPAALRQTGEGHD